MGKINLIKGNNKSKETPRVFMVSVSADVWAKNHKDACFRLKRQLAIGNPAYFEATEISQQDTYSTLDNGKDIKL